MQLPVIVGPTAVGKTEITLAFAKQCPAEIVSADSMQVYRGMDIGTAKPPAADRRQVPHHMVDIVDPDQSFNVSDYVCRASACISDIERRQHIPIVSGGTGLYIDALMDGFLFPDQGADASIRSELANQWQLDPAAVFQWLQRIDPVTAAKLHPHDQRRIIRALEVYRRTGRPLSELQAEGRKKGPRYHGLWFGLTRERSDLYHRVEERIDHMLAEGLIEEVEELIRRYPHQPTALQALGYKEIVWYLRGRITLSEAVHLLKRDTRRYAKRQLSWFRRRKEIYWFNLTETCEEHVFHRILDVCRNSSELRGIIG